MAVSDHLQGLVGGGLSLNPFRRDHSSCCLPCIPIASSSSFQQCQMPLFSEDLSRSISSPWESTSSGAMTARSKRGPLSPIFTSSWSRQGPEGQESFGFDISLFCAFFSRGHPEPPCLDQEELAKRAAGVVHPGRQRVSPFLPSLRRAGEGKEV